MSNTKYKVEKFTCKNNFSLWQRWMKDILMQQGVLKALLGKEEKLKKIKEEDWEDFDAKAASVIHLN